MDTSDGTCDCRSSRSLHFAAGRGHVDCVRYIAASAPKYLFEYKNDSIVDAICHAVWGGHTECVRVLLGIPGIKPGLGCRDQDGNVLHLAARLGRVSCLRLLLQFPNAPIHEIDGAGCTPLQIAALEGRADCVSLLASLPGARINAAISRKLAAHYGLFAGSVRPTVLTLAIVHQNHECVHALLATPGICGVDDVREHVLLAAVMHGRSDEFVMWYASVTPIAGVKNALRVLDPRLYPAARYLEQEMVRRRWGDSPYTVHCSRNRIVAILNLASDRGYGSARLCVTATPVHGITGHTCARLNG